MRNYINYFYFPVLIILFLFYIKIANDANKSFLKTEKGIIELNLKLKQNMLIVNAPYKVISSRYDIVILEGNNGRLIGLDVLRDSIGCMIYCNYEEGDTINKLNY